MRKIYKVGNKTIPVEDGNGVVISIENAEVFDASNLTKKEWADARKIKSARNLVIKKKKVTKL